MPQSIDRFLIGLALMIAVVPCPAEAGKHEVQATITESGGYYVDSHEDLRVIEGGNAHLYVRLESPNVLYLLRCPPGRAIKLLYVDNRIVHVNCINVSGRPVS